MLYYQGCRNRISAARALRRITWTVFMIAYITGVLASVSVSHKIDLQTIILVDIFRWFFLSALRTVIFITLVFSLSVLFFAWISMEFTLFLEHRSDYLLPNYDKVLADYLSEVAKENQHLYPWDINPNVLREQAHRFLDVETPLSDMFIHLRALAGRSLYEAIDSKRARLQVQTEGDLPSASQYVDVKEILAQLDADHSVAIVLGRPGAGKSTTLRWLAFHMAYACRRRFYPRRRAYLSHVGLSGCQIPILLRISEYAAYLSQNGEATVEDFLASQCIKRWFSHAGQGEQPNLLFEKLQNELSRGHCLVLLDGLNEVTDNHVIPTINTFILNNSIPRGRRYNRFIITSRIQGYSPGAIRGAKVFTLQDLQDADIEQFLVKWFAAVRHNRSGKHVPHQIAGAQGSAIRLLDTVKRNSNLRELAGNPLMLTMLAWSHYSGRDLSVSRVQLLKTATHLLLDSRQQNNEERSQQLNLAEQLLGKLAHRLHSSDAALNKSEVETIARETIAELSQQAQGRFYYTVEMIPDERARELIGLLRYSGLLIPYAHDDQNQELFHFMYPIFEDYFVALYLAHQQTPSAQELTLAFKQHHRSPAWHESLALTIAYLSQESNSNQASDLVESILDSQDRHDTYDGILQRKLLSAIELMLDSYTPLIEKPVQSRLARLIFDRYGDFLNQGRYVSLQRKLEEVTLRWLQAQALVKTERDDWRQLPLLETWHQALLDGSNEVRQEGAVRLLASIIHELHRFPRMVWLALVPPLFRLTNLSPQECFCPRPSELSELVSEPAAQAPPLRVEEYAFIALRLLGAESPAHWLRDDWLEGSKRKRDLLARLTGHSRELSYFMTPVSFPDRQPDAENSTYDRLVATWQQYLQPHQRKFHQTRRQHLLCNFQVRLLQTSGRARFPLAYLYKRMLEREEIPAVAEQDWRDEWDRYLREEMTRGRNATYQQSLVLRLLLYRLISERQRTSREVLARELWAALPLSMQETSFSRQQFQALMVITNMYLLCSQDRQRSLLYLHHLLISRYMRNLLDAVDIPDRPDTTPALVPAIPGFTTLQEMQSWIDEHFLYNAQGFLAMQNLHRLLDLREQEDLEADSLITHLCKLLEQSAGVTDSTKAMLLLALYTVILNKGVGAHSQMVQESIRPLLQQQHEHVQEHHLLTKALLELLAVDSSSPGESASAGQNGRGESPGSSTVTSHVHAVNRPPDVLAAELNALGQRRGLTKLDVELLLSTSTAAELSAATREQPGVRTAQEITWRLLTGQFSLDNQAQIFPFDLTEEALELVVSTLDDPDTTRCMAAAQLLQYSRKPSTDRSSELTKIALRTIVGKLKGQALSFRLFNPPGTSSFWQPDDKLFTLLEVLAGEAPDLPR